MKKTCATLLAEHGITLLTGTLLGATITAGMTYESSTDFWQTVGSLAAGLGTLGILAFGWLKADDWIKSNKQASFINLNISLLTTLVEESSSLSAITDAAVTQKNKADFEIGQAKALLLASSIYSTWRLLSKLSPKIGAHSDALQVENLCLEIQIEFNHKEIGEHFEGLKGHQCIKLINNTRRLERIIKRNVDTALLELFD